MRQERRATHKWHMGAAVGRQARDPMAMWQLSQIAGPKRGIGLSGAVHRERIVADIAAELRDILVFHLGSEEALLTDDARLVDDLGADRLDIVEVAMSCEERFGIDIPNHVAARFVTVGDAVKFIARLAADPGAAAVRPPPPPASRFRSKFARARHLCSRTLA